jgi:signal transduction histidine kinase
MDRFLHAERFRKGKVQVKPGKVDLGQLIAEVSTQFAYQARDRKLNLEVDRSDPCRAVTDRELVSLILQNLLSNALKYTPKGTVRISAAPGKAGEGCLLAVADEGMGIAKDKLSDMFTPFARGETQGQPGVGLGLSIARQAADLLGAKLWAESEQGKGSTFYLQLPTEPPAADATADPSGT